jgi:hypothetical protein
VATKKPAPTEDSRVGRGYIIRAEIALLLVKLKELEVELIELGPGRYKDPDEQLFCTAVGAVDPSVDDPTYVLRDGEEDKARQLAGEAFPELFERKVTYTPKPGFIDRADALLTPAKKRDIIALCYVAGKEKPGKAAYVTWK